jgi:small-conductance mechanosensitive channel
LLCTVWYWIGTFDRWSSCLNVGFGLLIQNTYSDFFAGLLFERPVKVGDFISFEGDTVVSKKLVCALQKLKTERVSTTSFPIQK